MKATTILHHSNLDRTNSCGVKSAHSTTNPADVTCKRCLKVMASQMGEPATPPAKPVKTRPFALVMDEQIERVDVVLSKPAAKPATVHLHDIDRHPMYQTWCKIPGRHSPDPADVTCKVCRAHIDGKAPLNAVPERVKAARKAFRSFVARVAYMVFMDEGCTINGSWSIKHTNMAGTAYEVSWSEVHGGAAFVDGNLVIHDLGKDIKDWMEREWSCGEDK